MKGLKYVLHEYNFRNWQYFSLFVFILQHNNDPFDQENISIPQLDSVARLKQDSPLC